MYTCSTSNKNQQFAAPKPQIQNPYKSNQCINNNGGQGNDLWNWNCNANDANQRYAFLPI